MAEENSERKEENVERAGKSDSVEIPVGKYLNKVRENPWIASSFVLGVLLIAVLAFGVSSGGTKSVSGDEVGQRLLDLYTKQIGDGLELKGVKETSGLYEVTFSYQGQEVPIYVTLDGENMVTDVIPLDLIEQNAGGGSADSGTVQNLADVPKSEVPKVELFVWGYCPYGVQAQDPFVDVEKLLGDSADFEVVLFHDGHGAFETQQNKIQSCIQKIDNDKYWDYAKRFVAEIYPVCSSSRDVECDTSESVALMDELGIDSDAVMSCVASEGDDLFASARQRASAYGVSGSPTLVVNGVMVNVARNAEAFKSAVCNAFENAPAECEQVLSGSTTTTTTGAC